MVRFDTGCSWMLNQSDKIKRYNKNLRLSISLWQLWSVQYHFCGNCSFCATLTIFDKKCNFSLFLSTPAIGLAPNMCAVFGSWCVCGVWMWIDYGIFEYTSLFNFFSMINLLLAYLCVDFVFGVSNVSNCKGKRTFDYTRTRRGTKELLVLFLKQKGMTHRNAITTLTLTLSLECEFVHLAVP